VSYLLALLNRLKAEARLERLTDSQQAARSYLAHLLHFPERVNLYGEAGSGKTFLGWALAREYGASFHTSPNAFYGATPNERRLQIVDNVPIESSDLRRLLAEMQLRNMRSAIIITQYANQLGLPAVHLPLPTVKDITIVYHNLSLLEHYALQPRQQGSLWQIVHSTLQ
jgi:hypothetical protein